MTNIDKLYQVRNATFGDHSPIMEDFVGTFDNSNNVNQLPTEVTKEQFPEILEKLKLLHASQQAHDELTGKGLRELKAKIDDAGQLGYQKGWKTLREYLATAADVVTLATPFLRSVFPFL